jgi:hypothetical protein
MFPYPRTKKGLIMTTIGVALGTLILTLGLWANDFRLIPELFRLNKQRQAEGYYMAQFEFKMVGLAYLLDRGEYMKAMSGLRAYHDQLESGEGLVKLPTFASKDEEMDFYLNLQDSATGTFMDTSFPYCTWEGPTGNVLDHLESLAKETGRPLKLKHPLRFFERIDTPAELRAYLDDIGHVGWIGTKLPESPFHFARDLVSYAKPDNTAERNGIHAFSPEWKRALLEWFRDNQDPETGYRGPRLRGSGKLTKLDLHNTSSILQGFIDSKGDDIDSTLRIGHRDRMFASTLEVMAYPVPDTSDLDEIHGWTLREGKGIMMLSRQLWKTATDEEKKRARAAFARFLLHDFTRNWSERDGAFRFYPDAGPATLDGTGSAIGVMDDAGAFTGAKQRRVWGPPGLTCADLGERVAVSVTDSDLAGMRSRSPNSVRLYRGAPDTLDFTREVVGVFRFAPSPIPDLAEIAPRLKLWADTTSQSLGNWISREEVHARLSRISTEPVESWNENVPLARMNEMLASGDTVTLVGFDDFQTPVARVAFRR